MYRMLPAKKFCQIVLVLFFICGAGRAMAQDTSSADGLIIAARKAAFDRNNYTEAKSFLFSALRKSPDYADVKIFLGRIYTWTKKYDSARYFFDAVIRNRKDYEDAWVAYTDMEYFADQYDQALSVCRDGLRYIPTSENLMLREAKLLNAQKKTIAAERSIRKLLEKNSHNSDAIALAKTIEEQRNRADSVIDIPPTVVTPNQDSLSADGLFLMARKAAFDDKNYALAKTRLWRALAISPGYADILIFLGRIHTWTDQYDSARYYFHTVLKAKPDYTDASVALADLEYWSDHYNTSIDVINAALQFNSESQDLWVRKARALYAARQYKEAQVAVDQALHLNHNNTEARALANRIKESLFMNRIGLSYDYVYFDKQFADPWHLVSMDYTRVTGLGSITGRINYANRFKENGVQAEIEAYPRISNTFYTYVNLGYSDKVGVFPQWRGGLSLYANLPASFEGELGFRYLKFSGDPTWIYTAYLGKYYKSWLFGFRTYLTPGTYTSTVSASYTATARYYYGSADDLIGFTAGYGISPDDRLNSIQLDGSIRLVSYKLGASFRKKISRRNVFSLDGAWFNQEYLPQTKGNQYQISIGWLLRF